ncbi:1-deoxy-D-xylulose-5-phosphate synthase [Actinosynnema sp. NPDC047251]|uniref:1-deoxy-D-xylulose-5-phosphate synthase n=1 Tax=Saccharothrix espanaensis (strain ATCC 51144 / DSM 44229 / JCM 9112 / NBRC 15066 / NRRL 15764) TaxID=1179773 RepID=K0JZA6_SACES|nr:1-deoxy-D-xylulose-5-phosphate synthase [Saccharothrix espanaensis]CCH33335.1 1-deoxy-D-xylulose-5-phosphate synthase [Saccharothrix espanaensis DSM 44229]
MTLLDAITGPGDVRALPSSALPVLAGEIRRFLIEQVSRAGGHLGPNLGAVELTIAVHRVFDSPHDVLLFDTGHQAYVHKVLTGRAAEFETLRRAGGLSGYPSAAESPHDVIENSHASTALSYADGVAKALRLKGSARRVVAIVGDGALTGGMAWEALNNLASTEHPVVIVLNDNGRSYAPTVGGLGAHLGALRSGRAEPGNLFQDLGLAYLGPVDGHDPADLECALTEAAALGRPVVVHCVTRKGKGYPPAEQDQADHHHAVSATGSNGGRTWTDVFGAEIAAIGEDRSDVVCLTAAMQGPTGLDAFAERFPQRVFDVGIAEQHAVTSAAGLAMAGLHPVVAVYATFISRAFDQVLLDVALHRLPVTFVLDRAGVTGPDGPSHHGMWDASVLPVVPGLRLAAPRDPARLRELLREAVAVSDGPTALRYPKAAAGADIPAVRRIGRCDVLREEPDPVGLLIAVGPMAKACLEAAEELAGHGVPVDVVDPRWTAPLDPALVKLAAAHQFVLAVEDTTATGALGGRLAQALAVLGAPTRVGTFALPASFLPHGSRAEILRAHGLDAAGITTTVLKRLKEHS